MQGSSICIMINPTDKIIISACITSTFFNEMTLQDEQAKTASGKQLGVVAALLPPDKTKSVQLCEPVIWHSGALS